MVFVFVFYFIIHLNTDEGFVSMVMLISDVCLDILDIISKYMCMDKLETCQEYVDHIH